MPPSLHETCQPLYALIGEWHGSGTGHYPGIAQFEYEEQIVISHVGKPFLTYSQKTKNPSDDQPMHSEQGYLRIVDDKNLEMVISQPTGIVEVHSGFYASNADACVIDLQSTQVAATATAKSVEQVHRLLRIADDTMTYDLSMAAVGKKMQHHLAASLERVSHG